MVFFFLQANVPSERTDGLSDAQLKALLTDLKSLIGTAWITDGVIQRIFAIFSTTFRNEKILLFTQGESTMLTLDKDAIARKPLLEYKLVSSE